MPAIIGKNTCFKKHYKKSLDGVNKRNETNFILN